VMANFMFQCAVVSDSIVIWKYKHYKEVSK
jgi:hypothetical protein